jgi:hypothetical protein
MSILDIWADKFIPAILQVVTVTKDADTGVRTESLADGATVYGVKYNRSEAARYFSQTWAMDISDIFVTDNSYVIHKDSVIKIGGFLFTCEEPVNVLEMGEVFTIGLRRKT